MRPLLDAARSRGCPVDRLPVLVEVRFPDTGASSDWFRCDDEDDPGPILDRLAPGAEVHLHSVWDVREPAGGILVRK